MSKTRDNSNRNSVLGNGVVLVALAVIAGLLLRGQVGDWSQMALQQARLPWVFAVLLAYAGFVAWMLWRSRPRIAPVVAGKAGERAVLVAYASQTGFARELAERSAQSLATAGKACRLLPLEQVDIAQLQDCDYALFVASTTGEGDPPDHAIGFVQRAMDQVASLPGLRYAVLALGDREYQHYCGFGHQLDDWLRRSGAQPLFDLVEVDNADQAALRHWQHHLGVLGGNTNQPDWAPPQYQAWTLAARDELNPGSVGGSVFKITLHAPPGVAMAWQAGDIAEIGPRHAPQVVQAWLQAAGLDGDALVDGDALSSRLARSHLPEAVPGQTASALVAQLQALPHREYSIASMPSDGSLQVVLRRMLKPDGSPGLGSGWLCDYAPIGGSVELRVRSNPNFHPPGIERPLLLVGNGTGIAGLRAQLKSRIDAGARRHWLVFGERNADRDFFFGEDIRHWRDEGKIERLDLAFSRDQAERIYVQHRLRDAASDLRQWVADGAAIYVCGSLAGMAPAVDAELRDTLGAVTVEAMLADGRYRRDVY